MSDILNDHSAKLNFKVMFKALAGVEFYCTGFGIPSVKLDNPQIVTPRGRFNEAGSRMEFSDVATMMFIIDKNFDNYMKAYNWMREFAPITRDDKYRNSGRTTCSAIIIDNGVPIKEFLFHDVLPNELGSIDLTNMDEIVTSIECAFTFSYSYFEINVIA
jgi:hypothetical protein